MASNSQPSGSQPLQPPAVGSVGTQGFGQPYPAQFRPAFPTPGQPFIPASASQQFRPVGSGISLPNVGMPPGHSQQIQFSQPMQQLPPRPAQPFHSAPSSQGIAMPYIQQHIPLASSSPQVQQATPSINNHVLGVGGPVGTPSYSFAPPSYVAPQNTANIASQFQSLSHMHSPLAPVGGQPWLTSGSQGIPFVSTAQPTVQESLATIGKLTAGDIPNVSQQTSDWQENEVDGRRYYYNKKTRQSTWEKPLELMTPIERADASTVWKEFTTPDGKKYYYNKFTKQSKWTMPEELKLAREKAEKEHSQATQAELSMSSNALTSASSASQTSTSTVSVNFISGTVSGVVSSPISVTPVATHVLSTLTSDSSAALSVNSIPATTASASINSQGEMTTPPSAVVGSTGIPSALAAASTTMIGSTEKPSPQDVANSSDGVSMQDLEESKKGSAGKSGVTPVEDKTGEDEPLVYASKQEAKNAFKALLESANVEADWTWEQAMRVIINDKRYGALKTLGERKQAFNEYLMQRKKLEAEERRMRQRKAREEFTKMLEESKELTSSIRWSKAITMFEDDERFKAVERPADREDLFKNYLVDLQKKEKAKALEEYQQSRLEFRQFLESCSFIKVDTQWRKVVDKLEEDERFSRLEKIDRLKIFQEYIEDLEKEEEEHKKRQKEQLKRVERKNRDEFRKMIGEHVASGIVTAKTEWRDYCLKIKESVPYHAIASNIFGSTPKDLFEDVVEELDNQYYEDKTRVKDAMKVTKMNIYSTTTYEDFKASILEDLGSPPISDINLQLIFEELLDRAKEKEDKEVKRRQRIAKDFADKLSGIKEVNASSNWEDCKQFLEECSEYRSMGDENLSREIFDEYVARLQEKAKERERKREEEKIRKEKDREEKEKRKEKEKKEREKEREREKGKDRTKKDDTDSENMDLNDGYSQKDERRREKERKHRKRHHNTADDVSSDKDEKEESKRSRRHSSDRKKSRKRSYTPESDSESKHKKHRRDYRDGSRRSGGHEELEDGELGEDGEIQ